MLKVTRRKPDRANAIDVRLTVSRVYDSGIEVTIGTPGRLKVGRMDHESGLVARRAKPAAPAARTKKS